MSAMTEQISGREQAARWSTAAREHWKAGNLARAAAYNQACLSVDPDRAELWSARADQLLVAANKLPLQEQTAVRLIVAGYRPESPEIVAVRDHNAKIAELELEL